MSCLNLRKGQSPHTPSFHQERNKCTSKAKQEGKVREADFFVLEEISELKSAKRGEASVLRLLNFLRFIQLINAFIHMPKTSYLQQSSCPMLFLGELSTLFSLTNPLDVSFSPASIWFYDCKRLPQNFKCITAYYPVLSSNFVNNPYNPPILALQKPLLHNYSFYETRGAYPCLLYTSPSPRD